MSPSPGPDLRQQLVDTTVELLRTQPPSAISLRAVARSLGVSSGAPYHHFPDKPALLAAVAQQGWAELNAALTACGDPDPRQALRAQARAYMGFALARPCHYDAMFLAELKDPDRFDELHAESERALYRLLGVIADALALPPESAELLQRGLASWATLHGFAVLTNSGVLASKADHVPLDVLVDGVIEAAVRAALGG